MADENLAAGERGISRWVHPILADPLTPVILVEGKSDQLFIDSVIRFVAPSSAGKVRVTYLEQFGAAEGMTGGVDELLKYLKANIPALRTRVPSAPVVVVVDWDSVQKKKEFDKHLAGIAACKVLVPAGTKALTYL